MTVPSMIIDSDSILAILTHKAQSHTHDRSRHLLCPSCRSRTKLYALGDGRRKCSACGMKFHPEKKTDTLRLRLYADLLLCFCLGITAKQASAMTGYHYRLISAVYDHFRILLASQNLTPGKMQLLTTTEAHNHTVHDSTFCRRCRSRFDCTGRKSGESPVFGVKILAGNSVFIDPLSDDEADFRFDKPFTDAQGKYSAYAGFICQGKFHRFSDNTHVHDGAERLWAWMIERLRAHHGIWKKNIGLYLKELEWKYNNRELTPDAQAMAIANLMPENFLVSWADRETITLDASAPAMASSR